MNRLTGRMADGTAFIHSETGEEGVGHSTTQRRLPEIISHLAEYEDTGLTPEEILDLMVANGEKMQEISSLQSRLVKEEERRHKQGERIGEERGRRYALMETIDNLNAQVSKAKEERDAAVEDFTSAAHNGNILCEFCGADCIDAGNDTGGDTFQCGCFEWRGTQETEGAE